MPYNNKVKEIFADLVSSQRRGEPMLYSLDVVVYELYL
jgi:hypothetical protein